MTRVIVQQRGGPLESLEVVPGPDSYGDDLQFAQAVACAFAKQCRPVGPDEEVVEVLVVWESIVWEFVCSRCVTFETCGYRAKNRITRAGGR